MPNSLLYNRGPCYRPWIGVQSIGLSGAKATTIDIYQVFADLLLKIIEGLLRTIALALNEQILDDICCEEHDENIDHVLDA